MNQLTDPLAKGAKNKSRRIGQKVGNIVAWLLAGCIIVIVALCVWMFYSLTMTILQSQCSDYASLLAYELENYPEGQDPTEMMDELKARLGCEFTIFHGDERAYTTPARCWSRGNHISARRISWGSSICAPICPPGTTTARSTACCSPASLLLNPPGKSI